jgi:hypothetical protein
MLSPRESPWRASPLPVRMPEWQGTRHGEMSTCSRGIERCPHSTQYLAGELRARAKGASESCTAVSKPVIMVRTSSCGSRV